MQIKFFKAIVQKIGPTALKVADNKGLFNVDQNHEAKAVGADHKRFRLKKYKNTYSS